MIKTSINLQDLRRKIYIKAKADKAWRFWGLYVHVCKLETLRAAYDMAKRNNGAPGSDGVTFEMIKAEDVEAFLEGIREQLINNTYLPMKSLRREIPKDNGKVRVLGIPTIRDRVVQGALKLILEPIFESDFQDGSYGYRPKRTPLQAVDTVSNAVIQGMTRVIDIDLEAYFDTVRHDILMEKVALRVEDRDIMHLLKLILKSGGKKGVPQGGVISPLLSNLYLNEVDKMLEKAKKITQERRYIHIEYVRFADDLLVLVSGHHKWDWLLKATYQRVLEEFSKLRVRVNLEKTKVLDLGTGERFEFLGFSFKRKRTRKGKWGICIMPRMKARTNLTSKLKAIFRNYRSQPIGRIISLINPILRGWLNYFRIGNSRKCFGYIQGWVERKLRRHLAKARQRKGFGWERWSSGWFYKTLGLYGDYAIRYYKPAKV